MRYCRRTDPASLARQNDSKNKFYATASNEPASEKILSDILTHIHWNYSRIELSYTDGDCLANTSWSQFVKNENTTIMRRHISTLGSGPFYLSHFDTVFIHALVSRDWDSKGADVLHRARILWDSRRKDPPPISYCLPFSSTRAINLQDPFSFAVLDRLYVELLIPNNDRDTLAPENAGPI